ncbi:hypothetical protein H4R20_004717 [Coemansia guatemalensis]|uniref:EF-hand domain-containing protein n=1 Tax=Coemansia guatemalensis TaxID=2761395 RepID=A0A9W8HVP7_9FUNG|nr:hypothetical protein H4R20_004717 [Coemansia guatemalensis]
MAAIELLPQDLFNLIALKLDIADICAVALTSRRLHKLARCDELWIGKIVEDFGDRDLIVDLLTEAGVDIVGNLNASTQLVPWKLQQQCHDSLLTGMECYRDRFVRVFPASGDDRLTYARDSEEAIDQVKLMLRDGPKANDEVFVEAAYRLVLVQEYFPASAECYYLWALICYMNNALNPSTTLLDIGHSLDSDFMPIRELMAEVQSMKEGVHGTNGDAPLLDATCSRPSAQLARALAIIFQRLDRDRDGVLNPSELAAMINITNGQPAPYELVVRITNEFGGQIQTSGGRRVTGWNPDSLANFFVAQTLEDPKETRQDLAKFGFDPHTLQSN